MQRSLQVGPVACMAALLHRIQYRLGGAVVEPCCPQPPRTILSCCVAQELMNHKSFTLFWDLDNVRVPARSLGSLKEHLKVCTQPEHDWLDAGQ